MTVMMIKPSQNLSKNPPISISDITTSTCPTWKLYENPFYKSHLHHQEQQQQEQEDIFYSDQRRIHRLYLPISARKIAASFWDLTFIRPLMESELDLARSQLVELKTELEYEQKVRKKLESTNKRMAKELAAERRGREALERVCEELAKEISSDKSNLNKMKREMEEERRMMRVAEVLREERVQMKLNEAKLLMEEKLAELEGFKLREINTTLLKFNQDNCSSGLNDNGSIVNSVEANGRRVGLVEVENPHIKRGIKGFVEFPRVVRAIGSKSRHLGTKLECQKTQLMILLKNKSLIRSNSLIMS
ncbi:hypothetical protein LguiA_015849 [Lonicera macranthoides]